MHWRPTLATLLVLVCAYSITIEGQLFPTNLSNPIGKWKEQITNQVNKAIGNFDKNLGKLYEGWKNTTKTLKDMNDCYVKDLAGYTFDIFNKSIHFKSIISQYYNIFPNKTITRKSIENLLNSTTEMLTRCLDPKYRSSARYGFTELSDMSLDDVKHLCGCREPTEVAATSAKKHPDCEINTGELPTSFDWRSQGIVTSIKNQGSCGSCWAFSALGAIESALVRSKSAPLTVDLSEQQLVNCAKSKGCVGGHSHYAFTFINKTGVANEAAKKYLAKEETCGTALPAAQRIRGFCIRSKFLYTSTSVAETLADETMARALVQFGPLYMTVDANPFNYRNYRAGLLDSPSCTTKINHAVILVGYDGSDNSWIIKNSWGDKWGDKGFFKVIRGKNMCGVNTEIAWPLL